MSVSPFLEKTFEMFSNPAQSDVCDWGPDGDSIFVKDVGNSFVVLFLSMKLYR
jgi:hypothetical protein